VDIVAASSRGLSDHFINKTQKSARSPGNCPRLINQWRTQTQRSKHSRNIPQSKHRQGTASARKHVSIQPATLHQISAPDTSAPCSLKGKSRKSTYLVSTPSND
ncbi:9181_t:CDS:1, partial [Paraglomus brasilianum]